MLEQAEYHIWALQSAFLNAVHKRKRAPGLAGFAVVPELVMPICSGSLQGEPRLESAKGTSYAPHMLQLYRLYAWAELQQDQATLRVIEEFRLEAVPLLQSVCSRKQQGPSTSSSSASSASSHCSHSDSDDGMPTAGPSSSSLFQLDLVEQDQEGALLALCLEDTATVKELIAAGFVSGAEALDAMADQDMFEAAADVVMILGSSRLCLSNSYLLNLSTDAAMSGYPNEAWDIIEHTHSLELVLAAVDTDQLVCLTGNPLAAFRLAWGSGHARHALAIYEDFGLRTRFSRQERIGLLSQAATLTCGQPAAAAAHTIVCLLSQEPDAGASMLSLVVRTEKVAIANCLLRSSISSTSMTRVLTLLRRIIVLEGSVGMKQLLL